MCLVHRVGPPNANGPKTDFTRVWLRAVAGFDRKNSRNAGPREPAKSVDSRGQTSSEALSLSRARLLPHAYLTRSHADPAPTSCSRSYDLAVVACEPRCRRRQRGAWRRNPDAAAAVHCPSLPEKGRLVEAVVTAGPLLAAVLLLPPTPASSDPPSSSSAPSLLCALQSNHGRLWPFLQRAPLARLPPLLRPPPARPPRSPPVLPLASSSAGPPLPPSVFFLCPFPLDMYARRRKTRCRKFTAGLEPDGFRRQAASRRRLLFCCRLFQERAEA